MSVLEILNIASLPVANAANTLAGLQARGFNALSAQAVIAGLEPGMGNILDTGAFEADIRLISGAALGTVYLTAHTVKKTNTTRALGFRFTDANGVILTVGYNNVNGYLDIGYNPAGSGNDITFSSPVAQPGAGRAVLEMAWTPSQFTVKVNNKLVFTKSWAGVSVAQVGFYVPSHGGAHCDYLSYAILSTTPLGMPLIGIAAPTVNTNTGTVTGTLPAALTTFDGDTSRVTYTEGSAQSTVLNAAGLYAIPSDAVIHAVKLTVSAAGAGGVAAGELTLETAAGASDVGEVNMASSYSPKTVVLNADPATSAAFIASELAAGTVKFGVREG